MNTRFFSLFSLLLAMSFFGGCSRRSEAAAPAAQEQQEESRVKRGTNGNVTVTLNAATQRVMGLQSTALKPVSLRPEVKGYGRVLDISPLGALVAELTTAQAVSQASQAELQRMKTLAAQNNASQRAVQTAEAAAVRDQTQVEAARLRLLTSWGKAIASRQDLVAFVEALGSQASALVELESPAGERLSGTPTGARVTPLADESQTASAEFLGPAPVVEPQMQGRGFLFLVTSNSVHLTPGASVGGFLSLPGEAQSGIVLPREAVVRFNGAAWVYLQSEDDTFERVEVSLNRPYEDGWFVQGSLKPQDKVVTTGAQLLLSEELKGQTEE